MSKTLKRLVVVMPTVAEDRCINAAARADPNALPLTPKQLQAMGNQTRANFEAQQKALATEGQALRQQVAILGAEARMQKEDAFNAKARGLQESAERRQAQIQQAAASAQQVISKSLQPIIDEIVKARGANLVVDKSAVIFANNNAFDITVEAIAQLDARMPTYKVMLGATPARQ